MNERVLYHVDRLMSDDRHVEKAISNILEVCKSARADIRVLWSGFKTIVPLQCAIRKRCAVSVEFGDLESGTEPLDRRQMDVQSHL